MTNERTRARTLSLGDEKAVVRSPSRETFTLPKDSHQLQLQLQLQLTDGPIQSRKRAQQSIYMNIMINSAMV